MKISRMASVMAGLVCSLLLTSCGDQYRPVIEPFPTSGGDPKSQSFLFVANQGVRSDGIPCAQTDPCPASTSDIDTPGEVNMLNHIIGETPWSMLLVGSELFIANRDSNSISAYSPFSGGTVSTISLPVTVDARIDNNTSSSVNVAPVVGIAGTQGSRLFTVMPACASLANNVCTAANPNAAGVMGVIDLSTNLFTNAYQVGSDPVSVVQLPDASKVYVVNRVSNSLTVFAGSDQTNLGTIAVGAEPVMAIPTPDSKFLFVLNRSASTISVVNTATNAVTLTASFGTGFGSAQVTSPLQHPMFYDASNKTRLYVTNPKDNTVTVFDTSTLAAGSMNVAATISLPAGSSPSDITVLRTDGSRAYVLNQGNGGSVGPSVSVINTNNFTVSTVPGFSGTSPRAIFSTSDGSKVFVINTAPTTLPSTDPATPGARIVTQQPGTNVILTSSNTFLAGSNGTNVTIVAPFQDPVNCTIDTPQPWNPNFAYTANATVTPRTPNGHAYLAAKVTKSGTSGANEPTFCTTAGCTVTDSGVTWQESGAWPPQGSGAPSACPRQQPNLGLMWP